MGKPPGTFVPKFGVKIINFKRHYWRSIDTSACGIFCCCYVGEGGRDCLWSWGWRLTGPLMGETFEPCPETKWKGLLFVPAAAAVSRLVGSLPRPLQSSAKLSQKGF